MEGDLSIRESVLLKVIDEARLDSHSEGEREPGALTTVELCERLGWSDREVLKLLSRLKKKGLLVVTRIPIVDLSERATTVPGYRIGTGPLGELMNGNGQDA